MSSALEIVNRELGEMVSLPDAEAALALDSHIRALDEIYRRGFVERGVILREFRDRKLWKHLGQSSFDGWIASSCRWSRADCYAAMRALDELSADIPIEKLKEIPRSNIRRLQSISSGVRSKPEILEAARTMTERNFQAHIAETQPDQHIDYPGDLHLHPGRSGVRKIEEWIAYALEHDLADSRDDAVVKACEMAMNQAELDEELASMPTETYVSQV